MLQEVFPKSYRYYQQSPWGEELQEFGVWLRTTGYSCDATSDHLRRLKHALELMGNLLPNSAFTAVQLQQAFRSPSPSLPRAARYRATQRAYQHFLASKGRLITPPNCDRFAVLRLGYQRHLAELRGFAAPTIQQHDGTARDFLSRILSPYLDLADLTSADIERYLLLKSSKVKRQTLQHTVAQLRSFLRYIYERGEIRSHLAGMIDTPRVYRDELLPKALDWELVQKLLRSIDLESKTGWRDFTILHLMAFYGLRPSEIVSLHWDSIDWRASILHVEQRKTRSPLVLPLAPQTLDVLRNYLSRGRPSNERPELFLSARSPVGFITGKAVTLLFQKWVRRSGLPLNGYSVYCLRHTFAMRLLGRGVGVKAIGDLLGHHSLESTCQYLRLDVNMLRQVALPVPNVEPKRRSQ